MVGVGGGRWAGRRRRRRVVRGILRCHGDCGRLAKPASVLNNGSDTDRAGTPWGVGQEKERSSEGKRVEDIHSTFLAHQHSLTVPSTNNHPRMDGGRRPFQMLCCGSPALPCWRVGFGGQDVCANCVCAVKSWGSSDGKSMLEMMQAAHC